MLTTIINLFVHLDSVHVQNIQILFNVIQRARSNDPIVICSQVEAKVNASSDNEFFWRLLKVFLYFGLLYF